MGQINFCDMKFDMHITQLLKKQFFVQGFSNKFKQKDHISARHILSIFSSLDLAQWDAPC